VFLFVADRDNNAVRELNFASGNTFTFATNSYTYPANSINKPIGVAVDGSDNVYVLNYRNATNGTVLEFDKYGNFLRTNAMGLAYLGGIAWDGGANFYLTLSSTPVANLPSSAINLVPPAGNRVAPPIAGAGVNLQGIAVIDSGDIAVCDSGSNGVWVLP